MSNDYLSIARAFKADPRRAEPAPNNLDGGDVLRKKRNKRKKVEQAVSQSQPSASVTEYAECQAIHQELGIQEDQLGDYDHKASVAGGIPPLEAVLARQEWLAGIDWRYGLRCSLTGRQCRVCKGIPCVDSTAWPLESRNS